MRSLERDKAAPRGLVPEARRITDVAAVNDHVAEIRFGKSDFLLIPAPIDSRSAQRRRIIAHAGAEQASECTRDNQFAVG